MAKTKYWMSDGYGAKALIEGADERDKWKPLGWSEADEPAAGDRVWLRHEDHGGRALFPAESVDLWQQKGWQPSDPPQPINPFNAPQPADVVEAAPTANTTTSPAPAGKAMSDKSREQ
ncbi:hypothetical protein ACGFIY_21375 [Micromonospora chersina]|uniref:hypothetical protein n=1 Tax=Micromonospora chersina TaxID=47854 RepID=UPI003718F339